MCQRSPWTEGDAGNVIPNMKYSVSYCFTDITLFFPSSSDLRVYVAEPV